ncbi:MAG TPA: sigma 54-interacting transcriptional regulator [Gemmatimonadaceae bacterium]
MSANAAVSWRCIPSGVDRDATAILEWASMAACELLEWDPMSTHPVSTALVFLGDTKPHSIEQLLGVARSCPGRTLAVLGRDVDEMPMSTTIQLLAAGVGDVVPIRSVPKHKELVTAILQRWRVVDAIVSSDLIVKNVVGSGRAWTFLLRQVIEAARFSQAPVLITGDTGTGKELIARLIHSLDVRRKGRDLIVVDCTTLSPELMGSELFGHERGAFTGAVSSREGALRLADGGTLFLDEIGELPLPLQGQLLRALQEKVFKPVGGNSWRPTDFRLVCATNRDLKNEVDARRFRSDLYHRITGVTCRTPSLHERVEDIPNLAAFFMREALEGAAPPALTGAVLEFILSRTYRGNVRDLRLLMHSMAGHYLGTGSLTVGAIPADQWPQCASQAAWNDDVFDQAVRRAVLLGAPLKDIGRAAEEAAVRFVLADADSTVEAARRLGVTARAVQARRRAAHPGRG